MKIDSLAATSKEEESYEERRAGKYTFLVSKSGEIMHRLLTGRRRDTKEKFRSDKKKSHRRASSISRRTSKRKPKRKQRAERRKKG